MNPEQRFEENKRLVYYVFMRRFSSSSKNNQCKEDLIQEGMFALWRACLNFKEEYNFTFSTYAVLSIYNGMLSYTTRKMNKQPVAIPIESIIAEDKEGNEMSLMDTLSVPDEYSKKDTLDVISKTLEDFPDYYKPLIEKVIQGYTQNEIGALLNIPQSRVSRSLKKFKEEFQKHMEDVLQ